MRKSISILSIVCLILTSIVAANNETLPLHQAFAIEAQSDFISTLGPPLPNVVWHRTYRGPDSESARAMQCPNEDYILYGKSGNQALLLRTNSEGTYQWNRIFDTIWYDHLKSLVITADEGFGLLIRGDLGWTAPQFERLMLIRTDSSGVQLWNKTYEFSNNTIGSQHYFHSLSLCSDGGFAIGGNLEYFIPGQNISPWLLRTDSSGNPLWNYTYLPHTGRPWYYSSAMIQCQDTGFAFIGDFDDHPFLLRINSSGAIVWNRTYTSRATQMHHFVECSDEGFEGIGNVYDTQNNDYDLFLMKTNATGTLLWNKTFDTHSWDRGTFIIETHEHGLAFTGSTNRTGTTDSFLMVTDSEGNQEWKSTFGGIHYDIGLSILELTNSDFILSGYTESFGIGDTDCWLLKVREGYPPTSTTNRRFWIP